MAVPEISLFTTKDGSHTLLNAELNETYHSTHGALTEARHVFIEHGLKKSAELGINPIRVLEVGFGTGLNAILTAAFSLHHPNAIIEYTGLEPFPVSIDLIRQLNYVGYFEPPVRALFEELHQADWETAFPLTENMSTRKISVKLEGFAPAHARFDLVYFDAFAPNKQAEMWKLPHLKKMFDSLSENGILVTYCAQGQFKRDLKSAGFTVENRPGPPGKREMTLGLKRSILSS